MSTYRHNEPSYLRHLNAERPRNQGVWETPVPPPEPTLPTPPAWTEDPPPSRWVEVGDMVRKATGSWGFGLGRKPEDPRSQGIHARLVALVDAFLADEDFATAGVRLYREVGRIDSGLRRLHRDLDRLEEMVEAGADLQTGVRITKETRRALRRRVVTLDDEMLAKLPAEARKALLDLMRIRKAAHRG